MVSTAPRRSPHGFRSSAHHRPALVILVIGAALACLALGWWQWQQFDSASGTGQNLGYALQWPLFAAFVIYAYRKFVRYEHQPPQLDKHQTVTEIPPGVLPERPGSQNCEPNDPALQQYNAYLAELAEADNERDRTNQ